MVQSENIDATCYILCYMHQAISCGRTIREICILGIYRVKNGHSCGYPDWVSAPFTSASLEVFQVHTLRTGDVDLRFYITTVQDG